MEDSDPSPEGFSDRHDDTEAEGNDLTVKALSARLDAMDADLATLSEAVQEMAGVIRALAGDPRSTPIATAPLPEDGGPDEELVGWVSWLVRTYELHDIPECWAKHSAFVGELDALRVGWLATIGQGATGLDATHWHDLASRAFERFRRMGRSCIAGPHRPWTAPGWVNQPDRPLGRLQP